MAASSSSNYFILSEDDYYLDPNNILLDTDVIEYYNEVFSNNIGYLATMVDSKYHGYHAAISNGIVSRTTINHIGENALEKFYYIKINRYPQVNFSHLFLQNNVPIKDFRDRYRVLFWNSWEEHIEDYSVKDVSEHHIFIPVQFIARKIKLVVGKHQP